MVTGEMRRWINDNLGIVGYLGELGTEVPPSGKVLCPFHHNVGTPSAKVYPAGRVGGGTLRCFMEQRTYYTYDVLVLLGYSPADMRAMVPEEHWYGMGMEPAPPGLAAPDWGSLPPTAWASLEHMSVLWAQSRSA
jgi:hypothetical protein